MNVHSLSRGDIPPLLTDTYIYREGDFGRVRCGLWGAQAASLQHLAACRMHGFPTTLLATQVRGRLPVPSPEDSTALSVGR